MTELEHTAEERAIWERYRAGRTADEAVCPDANALAGWLDGHLSDRERDNVERHLAVCPDCIRAVLDVRSMLESGPIETPAGLAQRLKAGPFDLVKAINLGSGNSNQVLGQYAPQRIYITGNPDLKKGENLERFTSKRNLSFVMGLTPIE